MKVLHISILLAMLALTGCVTNDFKVVDALRKGMSKDEARTTIANYGFARQQALERPTAGWTTAEKSYTGLAERADWTEKHLGTIIGSAEYYPVHHGMFGYGELCLFYDAEGRLIDFYRHQIN